MQSEINQKNKKKNENSFKRSSLDLEHWEETKTNGFQDYIVKTDEGLSFIIPDIKQWKIEVTESESNRIEFLIFVYKKLSLKVVNKKSNQTNKINGDSKTQFDYTKKEFWQIYDAIEEKDIELSNIKSKYAEMFNKEAEKTIKISSDMINDLIENNKRKNCNQRLNIQRIKGYSWNDINSIMNKYDSFWKKKDGDELITNDFISKEEINLELNKNIEIFEYFYGSCCKWWKLNPESEVEATKFKNKIKDRHTTIKFLMDYPHLDLSNSKFYCKQVEESLKETIKLIDNNWFEGRSIKISANKNIKIGKKFDNIFDMLYTSNNTLIRIESLVKWNEITSNPRFLKQTLLKQIVGFEVKELNNFYGKYNYFNALIYRCNMIRPKVWRWLFNRE